MSERMKIFWLALAIAVVAGILIWAILADSPTKNPATNIFLLESGLQGKWADAKHENTVYFFTHSTFAWQQNPFETIGTYQIIRMGEKQLFLKLEMQSPGHPEIRIYKFTLLNNYDADNRFTAFTLEPLDSDGKKEPLTLRRQK